MPRKKLTKAQANTTRIAAANAARAKGARLKAGKASGSPAKTLPDSLVRSLVEQVAASGAMGLDSGDVPMILQSIYSGGALTLPAVQAKIAAVGRAKAAARAQLADQRGHRAATRAEANRAQATADDQLRTAYTMAGQGEETRQSRVAAEGERRRARTAAEGERRRAQEAQLAAIGALLSQQGATTQAITEASEAQADMLGRSAYAAREAAREARDASIARGDERRRAQAEQLEALHEIARRQAYGVDAIRDTSEAQLAALARMAVAAPSEAQPWEWHSAIPSRSVGSQHDIESEIENASSDQLRALAQAEGVRGGRKMDVDTLREELIQRTRDREASAARLGSISESYGTDPRHAPKYKPAYIRDAAAAGSTLARELREAAADRATRDYLADLGVLDRQQEMSLGELGPLRNISIPGLPYIRMSDEDDDERGGGALRRVIARAYLRGLADSGRRR